MRSNHFQFGDHTFLQTTGIAMGAAFSPMVANIYMPTLLPEPRVGVKRG